MRNATISCTLGLIMLSVLALSGCAHQEAGKDEAQNQAIQKQIEQNAAARQQAETQQGVK